VTGAPEPRCSVCRARATRPFITVDGRAYLRCETCSATFLCRSELPGPDVELAHYRLHDNDSGDPRYRRFLAKLTTPLEQRLAPGARVLDYGCGPGPALATMLTEAGHEVSVYDPFFRPDRAVLERRYDAVTCTEVIEHFHHPADELDRLDTLLLPGGWLGLMTCFQTDDALFAGWHYRRDPTHVTFYREETLRYVASQRDWSCEIIEKDVALLRKPEALPR
jgi:SAM-dependent methyltransferase